MHYRINCIDRFTKYCYNINEVATEENGEISGYFGPPTSLNRIVINKYISDYVHNDRKKSEWQIKVC